MSSGDAARARRLRHLWIAAAIAVPLVTLLALEFRALSKLEETAAVTQRMALRTYAKAVVRHVDELYQGKAREALALAEPDLADAEDARLEAHFARVAGPAVRSFFAVRFAPDGSGPVRFFAGDRGARLADADARELRAVNIALAPWRVVAADGGALATAPTEANENDPEARIVLRPVLDTARGNVAGVVGFVVDSAYVQGQLLPEAIEAERSQFPSAVRDDVAVELRPRPEPIEPVVLRPPDNEVDVAFRLVFADQALHVQAGYATPEQWARQSLAINLSLSLAATLVLVSALALALRSAARATALSQMKTEFVSNVSHELRTPLSSIQIFAEFLRRGRVHDAKKVEEYGASIETEARRLSRLVENLLDFSRIESGAKLYRRETVAPEDVVAEALDAFEMPLQQAGFRVQVRAPDDLPALSADRAALVQVIGNLIDNALKYARDGRRLEIDLAREGDFVVISVRDAGSGIASAEQARIFEKFYRVSTGLVHDAQGSGLGLAIVRHVVEAHGGSVEVRSREGEGATFEVRLPTATAPAGAERA
jgi:two-component system phosphate regulon sensor histidine kinase PhoR